MTSGKLKYLFVSINLALFLGSCTEKDKPQPENEFRINFVHTVNNINAEFDEMIYTNAAGNQYEVTEIMYFVSDLKLHKSDGQIIEPATWDDIHYIDTNIPSTLEWLAGKNVPQGVYDSITFTFGISEEKNQSFMFVNPPEVNMAWPEVLGGGYHYLMLNGWWKDLNQLRRPFNFHLGIGQIYKDNSGQVPDIIGFIHNNFTVRPSGDSFSITSGQTNTLEINMHIDSWFDTPIVYDHNTFGGAIMQNQEAMHVGVENGKDAFSVRKK